jgi:hypothetical protein
MTASIATGQAVLVVGGGVRLTSIRAALRAVAAKIPDPLKHALALVKAARLPHATTDPHRSLNHLQAGAIDLPVRWWNGNPKSDDRVRRGQRHQVAGVQYGARPERFRLGDGRGERLATHVAVEDDAMLQATPSGTRRAAPCQAFLRPHKIPLQRCSLRVYN